MIRERRQLMGMPITVEILDPDITDSAIEMVFEHFAAVDRRFSPYRSDSELSRLNRGEIDAGASSDEMRLILRLSEQTRRETGGYFDIRDARHDNQLDPSGIVKGWAIQQAAMRLQAAGFQSFYIDAGGDIQVSGANQGRPWRVGIRNPFNHAEHVKVLEIIDRGVATSGTAVRGQHIYDPFRPEAPLLDVASLTVIGPNVYEADRFATAAFAMGRQGIRFIESITGLEGYQIDAIGQATYTSGFAAYVSRPVERAAPR